MAGRADIQAGSAFVRLFLKDDITRILPRLLSSIGRTVAVGASALATAAAGTIAVAARHFAKAGSEINDLSQRMGISAESFSELKFAAEQSGVSIEQLEVAFKSMAKHGIAAADFDKLAAEIAAIEDPTERAQRALEVWGKSGTKLLPMIHDLAALRAEARELGIVPSAEEVARADKLGDTFDKLKAVLAGGLFRIGSSAALVLQPLFDTLVKVVGITSKWIAENEKVTASLKTIGDALNFDVLTIRLELTLEKMRAIWHEFTGEITKTLREIFTPTWLEGAMGLLGRHTEFGQAFKDTLKGMEAERRATAESIAARILELEKRLREKTKLIDRPSESLKNITGEGSILGKLASASSFSVGGALALGFGGGGGDVAKMTLDEIRAVRKAAFENLKLQKAILAAKERPGIFLH